MPSNPKKKVRLIDDKGFSFEIQVNEVTHYIKLPLFKGNTLTFKCEKLGKIPTYKQIT